MTEQRGFFIVLYGINNTGKSLQAKKLSEWFNKIGTKAEYLKYPIYRMETSGPIINYQLRGEEGQTIPEDELQLWFAVNRLQYQPFLKDTLESGITVVAEDYTGTGLAWGEAKGADPQYLRQINKVLLKEDLSILFDGERFKSGIEERHVNENNPYLIDVICRKVHQELAKEFGWKVLDSHRAEEIVFNDLVSIAKRELKI